MAKQFCTVFLRHAFLFYLFFHVQHAFISEFGVSEDGVYGPSWSELNE